MASNAIFERGADKPFPNGRTDMQVRRFMLDVFDEHGDETSMKKIQVYLEKELYPEEEEGFLKPFWKRLAVIADDIEEKREAAKAAAKANKIEVAKRLRLSQFNRIRVSGDKTSGFTWHGKYRNDVEEEVTGVWVEENFKQPFIDRCHKHVGEWVYVPIGKEKPASFVPKESLKGMCTFGTQSPLVTPEVLYRSGEGQDFCLPNGAASAAHHLGDTKLSPLLVEKASKIEGMEKQMEEIRSTADTIGWKPTIISSVDDVSTFDPLTACPNGSVLVMHIKQTDGSEDHSVAISLGYIFDANRSHALPLSKEGLLAIQYDGIVSATILTPKKGIAKALKRKRDEKSSPPLEWKLPPIYKLE